MFIEYCLVYLIQTAEPVKVVTPSTCQKLYKVLSTPGFWTSTDIKKDLHTFTGRTADGHIITIPGKRINYVTYK